MSRSPRITGAELVAALAKAGLQIVRVRGATTFFDIQMAARLLCLPIRVKLLGQGYCTRSYATVN